MQGQTIIRTAVCVPTLRRPVELARLLDAILELDTDGIDLVVIVVDNDPEGSAEPLIERYRATGDLDIIFDREPTPGYVAVRNRLMRLVPHDVEWVFMIDDDSLPASPGWLRQLLHAAEAADADMACGPVVPMKPDDWVGSPELLSGAAVTFDKGPSGSSMRYGWTGNLMVRRALVVDDPFDERFALTGAEDAEFTLRRTRAGHRLVWAPDALVHTRITGDRLDPRRLIDLRRGDSAGLAMAYRSVDGRLPTGVALRSLARLAESTVARILARVVGNDERHFTARLRQAGAIGMLRSGLLRQPPPRRLWLDEWVSRPSTAEP